MIHSVDLKTKYFEYQIFNDIQDGFKVINIKRDNISMK